MPIHDWSKVVAGNFHDFHQAWINEIRDVLNEGLLPEGFYAMAEQVAKGPAPDVIGLQSCGPTDGSTPEWDLTSSGHVFATMKRPPQVRFTEQAEIDIYAARADRVSVRHFNGDRVVAMIEIVSFGNKSTEAALDRFTDKLIDALDRGGHLMVIDLHKPHTHDLRGIHAAYWERVQCVAHSVTEEQPYGVSSYTADTVPTAYFEPVGLGEPLPDMPLFLTTEHYVNIPLEKTYMARWNRVPKRWRDVIEATE